MGEKRIDKYVFSVNSKIGEGSYATVYRGQNEKTGEKVAIKMLSKSVINAYITLFLMKEMTI